MFICGFLPRKNVSFSTKVAHALFLEERAEETTDRGEKKRFFLSFWIEKRERDFSHIKADLMPAIGLLKQKERERRDFFHEVL